MYLINDSKITFCVNLTVATVNFLLVDKMICDSMVSWTDFKGEVPHYMQVNWLSG